MRQKRIQNTSERGLQRGWTRATFILKAKHLEQLKQLAYRNRKTIKEIVDEAFNSYFTARDSNPDTSIDKRKKV
jgi:hypothetical protein